MQANGLEMKICSTCRTKCPDRGHRSDDMGDKGMGGGQIRVTIFMGSYFDELYEKILILQGIWVFWDEEASSRVSRFVCYSYL